VLRTIYDEHAGLRDRFVGAGNGHRRPWPRIGPERASRGRASGQAVLTCAATCPAIHPATSHPRRSSAPRATSRARVAVRFDEVIESTRLIQRILRQVPSGLHQASVPVPTPDEGAFGVGMIEGWRGPIFLALEAGDGGMIRRCHPHDPSWHELARDRARSHRQYRAGFSADQ